MRPSTSPTSSSSSTGSAETQPPTAEQLQRWQRTSERPDNEAGAAVALSQVLARTEEVAVLLGAVEAYRSGFAFTLSVRVRRSPADHHDLFAQVAGHASDPEKALLVGVQYADGRRGDNLPVHDPWPPADSGGGQGGGQGGASPAQRVSLVPGGGGGSGRRFEQSYWVAPLPPPGPVTFVVRWDAQQLAETAVDLDGTAIAAAGAGAIELWPWEPEPQEVWAPREPVRPAQGWFAQR